MPQFHVNYVTISGFLGKDPVEVELKNKASKYAPMVRFEIAHPKRGARPKQPAWFGVVAWGEDAKNVLKLKFRRGDFVVVHGHIDSFIQMDRGERRRSVQVVSRRVLLVAPRKGAPDLEVTDLAMDWSGFEAIIKAAEADNGGGDRATTDGG